MHKMLFPLPLNDSVQSPHFDMQQNLQHNNVESS